MSKDQPLPPEAKRGELWVWSRADKRWKFTGTRLRPKKRKRKQETKP